MNRSALDEPVLHTLQEVELDTADTDADDFDTNLLKDKDFIQKVRSRLRTEEQQRFFDFLTDVPKSFALSHVNQRWTHELIADYLKIDQARLPSLNKSIKRACRKQIRILHIHEGSRVQVTEEQPMTTALYRKNHRRQVKSVQLATLYT
jgi:hypothetical protein